MTSVNITAVNNTAIVTEGGSSTVVTIPQTSVVTASTAGPRGPVGSDFDLQAAAKVDKSVVYYDAATNEFKADATWTISTLVFGGDF